MMKPSFFKSNPAFLTEQQLCQSFVVRRVDLELLLERIRENTRASNQHLLVIGARGMGKTTLVLRAATAIEHDPELSSRWYPIRFSEENYEVSNAAELWLEALRHLAMQTGLPRWQEAYRALKHEHDATRLREGALARLLDYADETGKRLILIVENLNMLLGSQISDDEGWTLRHTLLNEPRIMLLATATSRFNEIDDASKPFYDLLWVHELEPLDTEECRALWQAVSGIEAPGHRIRPIQILTGGNPRLLAILASFASQGSLRELISDLERWVDDHTSYIKANVEMLPPLERKVYVTLANIWSPATAREVADTARMQVNKASALLNRLCKRGAVTEQKAGRASRYQVAERMYNIYYLMRQHSSRSARVRAIVEFMIHYYEHDEIAQRIASIGEEACHLSPGEREDHFFVYAGILQRHPDLRRDAIRATGKQFFSLDGAPPFIRELAQTLDGGEIVSEIRKSEDLTLLIQKVDRDADDLESWRLILDIILDMLATGHDLDDAQRETLDLRHLQPSRWQTLRAQGLTLVLAKYYAAASEALRQSLQLNPDQPSAWSVLATLLEHHLDDSEGAMNAYHQAVQADPSNLDMLGRLVYQLEKLGQHAEASQLKQRLLDHVPASAQSWAERGNALLKLRMTDEAVRSYQEAIQLDPETSIFWHKLGDALWESVSRADEAEAAYRKATALQPDGYTHWGVLGSYLARYRQDFAEAEISFRRAIDLQPTSALAWYELGKVLTQVENRGDEDIDCFRESIKIDPGYHRAWIALASTTKDRDIEEAMHAYCKAIETQPTCPISWQGLSELLQAEELNPTYIEQHLQTLLQEHHDCAWSWGIRARFLQLVPRRDEDAYEAYQRALTLLPPIPALFEYFLELCRTLADTDAGRMRAIQEDIEKILGHTEDDPDFLDHAAWAIFQSEWVHMYADAERWARAALALRPGDSHIQHTLACILLELGQIDEALELARDFLSVDKIASGEFPEIVELFVRATAAGHGREALDILEQSRHGSAFEPLIVALKMALGEECNAPQEVIEIAKDVLLQIDTLSQSSSSNPAPASRAHA